MKQTSQRSLLFRQNVNRTEEDRRRVCPRQVGRGMRTRLRPRRRAVDRAAMRSHGNHFRQLALRRKVAGDVRVVGSMIAYVGKSFMRIEHEYLLAKLLSDQVERRNEVRIPADEGNGINVAREHIVEHVGCDIDVRPFLLQLDDMHSAVGRLFAIPALAVDCWHPDLVPVVIPLYYFQPSDFGECAQIYSLSFDSFGVVWICADTCGVEFDDVKYMIVFYQRSCERQRVKPFDAIVAAKKPIVKVPRINIDVCSHFHKMLRPRPSRIGASPRIGRASRSDMNRLTGSVGIIPNIISWRNGVWRQNRIMEAA